ncbi:subtilisin family serine protease [Stackebrandtia albiflava]|uniref:Subtilisin family serine protease n=1 Tax=Stackebrandtia albiflava TaxID=406432 RepID=A0A562V3K0_9ACTN|nr:S8 family serine peptidase [Stackebrandtia albiflava]TWJ12479.1 subtilisin family serine protease [Stackebrandtia albiflava]
MTPLRPLAALGALAVGTALAVATAPAAHAEPATGPILMADAPDRIPDVYLVDLADDAAVATRASVTATADRLTDAYGGQLRFTYHAAMTGFSLELDEAAAKRLAADPAVESVEAVGMATLDGTQTDAPWGLDRVDQRDLPLNQTYEYPDSAGEGVTVYVLDTGNRFSHRDFGGRASAGPDFITPGGGSTDCHGHGTHVASTAVGTTYGVAKRAETVALRVLDCGGSGPWDGIIGAVDWVTDNGVTPSVVNMSLGGNGQQPALEQAVRNSIAAGYQYSLAAGNDNANACNFTPARVGEAITVGATSSNDGRASFSNYGSCLDVFAPGNQITAASHRGDTLTTTMSGTSMAAPHVAGIAALYLAENPSASPAQVRNALVNNGSTGKVGNPGSGSPNVLGYTGFIDGGPPPTDDFSVSLSPASGEVAPGGSVGADVSMSVTSGAVQDVTLSASGLPSGATATFDPAETTSDGDARLTIATSTGTPEGAYTVTVTATGTEATRTATFRLQVGDGGGDGPTAAFTVNCFQGIAICMFDAAGSQGDIASYRWAFGDGATGQGVFTHHWYGAAGTYRVTLTVTDTSGATHTTTRTVTAG